jgi:hypothetical protein
MENKFKDYRKYLQMKIEPEGFALLKDIPISELNAQLNAPIKAGKNNRLIDSFQRDLLLLLEVDIDISQGMIQWSEQEQKGWNIVELWGEMYTCSISINERQRDILKKYF